MISGIHHVAISTPDMERALGFYRDLLGLRVVHDAGWKRGTAVADAITRLDDSSARQVLLRAGNAFVELFEYASPRAAPGDPGRPVCDHGITHLCLDVDDLDAEHDRLVAAGVEFHCPPQDLRGGVRCTYARDPDGNVVELQELTPAETHRWAAGAVPAQQS
jgi:catechol 2,3-dioxygenase-like lactoylglutathione lyase family enzyme